MNNCTALPVYVVCLISLLLNCVMPMSYLLLIFHKSQNISGSGKKKEKEAIYS